MEVIGTALPPGKKKTPFIRVSRPTRRGTLYTALKLPDKPPIPPKAKKEETNSRVFDALCGRSYKVELIPNSGYINAEEDKKIRKDHHRTPSYIDSFGDIYSLDYIPIDNYTPNIEQALEHGMFIPNAETYKAFPMPEHFNTYSEYNESLSEWHARTQSCLGKIQLPNITGRSYYRPRMDLFSSDQSAESYSDSDSFKDSPTIMKSLPDDIDESELEMSNWQANMNVPWQTTLFPSEPEPESYATFEAYESAMKHWAILCQTQMEVIPPHPSQLSKLILLKTAQERKVEEQERAAELKKTSPMESIVDKKEESFSSGPSFTQFMEDPLLPFTISNEDKKADMSFTKIDFERSLIENENEILEAAQSCFSALSADVDDSKYLLKGRRICIPSNNRVCPLTPEIISPFLESVEPVKDAVSEENIDPFHSETKPIPNASYEFPLGYESNVPEEDTEPLYHPPFALNYLASDKIITDDEYRSHAILLQNTVTRSSRHDQFFSYSHKDEHESDWTFQPDNFVESLRRLIQQDRCSLDHFQTQLATETEQDFPLMEFITPMINDDKLPLVLELFDQLHSPLGHVKFAHFMGEYLITEAVDEAILQLIQTSDTLSFYRLGMILNHFKPVDRELWRCFDSILLLVQQAVPSAVTYEFIQIALCDYYIQHIQSIVSTQNRFLEIQMAFTSGAAKIRQKLLIKLRSQTGFFMSDCSRFLMNPSEPISQLFTVVLTHLLTTKDNEILEVLSREELCIMDSVREMNLCKFRHVRYYGNRLLQVLIANPTLSTAFIRKYYQNMPENLLPDLFSPLTPNEMGGLPPFVKKYIVSEMELVKERGISASSISHFKFLLQGSRKDSLYHNIFKKIKEAPDLGTKFNLQGSQVMQSLLEAYTCADIIEAYESEAASKGSMSHGVNLLITPKDLLDILELVCSSTKGELVVKIKTRLLYCVALLTKQHLIFDSSCSSKQFHTMLVRCCRDGSDYHQNRSAWRLFYLCFRNHHGFLTYLEQNGNVLNQLMELISSGVGNIVTTNCLDYFCKILNLVENETALLQKTGSTSRGDDDLKSIERDVKTIVNGLVKHCLKIHLIFKRLEFNNINGPTYLSVCRFYYQLHSIKSKANINGSKLYKELTKNKDYKQLVSQVVSMFGSIASDGKHTGTVYKKMRTGTLTRSSSIKASQILKPVKTE